jgi:nitroimidazol reductase NimA-like FMN-containing flavoprotein (pyridoxamine 5'-phosphate oxidase superfamily)
MLPTQRTKVSRAPQRASYDDELVDRILDEAYLCHLAFIHRGYPVITPTLFARVDDHLYVHGSAASRTLRALGSRIECCLNVTHLDGLVLARSAVHHSANYRSVTVFGRGKLIAAAEDKLRALRALTEKIVPGRWDDVRPPTEEELRATSVLRLPLSEASAKVRSGPPQDDEADLKLRVWAGVIPLRVSAAHPRPDQYVEAGMPPPGASTIASHLGGR